jgi:hypothetical protein
LKRRLQVATLVLVTLASASLPAYSFLPGTVNVAMLSRSLLPDL